MAANPKAIAGLYLIADRSASCGRPHEDVVRAGLEGGARVVQLRDKPTPTRELYAVALSLRRMTEQAGALFIVDDSVELALAVGADGVHLGQDDMPVEVARALMGEGRLVGVSTHSLDEALAAVSGGADYIGFGPIYLTATKDAGTPKGPEGLRLIRERVSVPIVAIGGINEHNGRAVIEAGADALAVIGAVCAADDVAEAARRIAALFK